MAPPPAPPAAPREWGGVETGLELTGEVAGRHLVPRSMRLQRRLLLAADAGHPRDGAARVEPATRGWVDRRRDLTYQGERRPAPIGHRVRERDRGEERIRVGVLRPVVDVLAVPRLDDLGQVH